MRSEDHSCLQGPSWGVPRQSWIPIEILCHICCHIFVYKWLFISVCLATLRLIHATPKPPVCSYTYTTSPGTIDANSEGHQSQGFNRCQYFLKAPEGTVITLNFTNIYGFQPTLDTSPHPDCKPYVEIVEVASSGQEFTMVDNICREHRNFHAPQVFQSKTHFLKLTFEWLPGGYSGFTLNYDFHIQKLTCEFRCADQSCLPDLSLVCNHKADCQDGSDEAQCQKGVRDPTTDASTNYVLILVIVIAVVFTLGVIGCIVSHYRLLTRLWGEQRHRDSNADIHRLNPNSQQPHSSEVVYVPGFSQERYEREAARDRLIRLRSIQTDSELNLPPSIPISEDGEEGYTNSQRLLHLSCDPTNEVDRESVRPPPNRTISNSESPLPYRSQSFGSAGYLDRSGKTARIQDCSAGSPTVVRCHSMSNNNTKPQNSNLNSFSSSSSQPAHSHSHPHHPHQTPHYNPSGSQPGRTSLRPPSMGHSRDGSSSSSGSGGASYGPPPEYSDVIANFNNVFNNKRSDSNV